MKPFDAMTLIRDLWWLRRDIVSDGFDQALERIKTIVPEMEIHRFRSGEEAWTWIIPEKWTIRGAHIKDGERTLVSLQDHPLSVMSYSTPVAGRMKREELLSHLRTRPQSPHVIPFEFSYYQKSWAFCLPHARLSEFTASEYDVLIDASFEAGELKVGSLILPGANEEEIVLIAHLCHPAMAEDDLSGVAALLSAAGALSGTAQRRYTYRFLLVPETIGSIAFLSRNEGLIPNMKFAMFLEMLGHDDVLSLQRSKQANTWIDRAAELALQRRGVSFRLGAFREVIGNDEEVFNGPGVNIPTISLSRSKFWSRGEWPYPEYHSSADTPDIISPQRLAEATDLVVEILAALDGNFYPRALVKGPMFLSRYGLWVDWREHRELSAKQYQLFDYLDGSKSVIDIAYELKLPVRTLKDWLEQFAAHGLIEKRRDAIRV